MYPPTTRKLFLRESSSSQNATRSSQSEAPRSAGRPRRSTGSDVRCPRPRRARRRACSLRARGRRRFGLPRRRHHDHRPLANASTTSYGTPSPNVATTVPRRAAPSMLAPPRRTPFSVPAPFSIPPRPLPRPARASSIPPCEAVSQSLGTKSPRTRHARPRDQDRKRRPRTPTTGRRAPFTTRRSKVHFHDERPHRSSGARTSTPARPRGQ